MRLLCHPKRGVPGEQLQALVVILRPALPEITRMRGAFGELRTICELLLRASVCHQPPAMPFLLINMVYFFSLIRSLLFCLIQISQYKRRHGSLKACVTIANVGFGSQHSRRSLRWKEPLGGEG